MFSLLLFQGERSGDVSHFAVFLQTLPLLFKRNLKERLSLPLQSHRNEAEEAQVDAVSNRLIKPWTEPSEQRDSPAETIEETNVRVRISEL